MANNIKSQLFSGVFYTALAKYSGVVISLVVAGILARLLSPDDFGIVAVATVIIAFFNLLTDMGVSPAIVQHKSLTKDDLSDIFSFTVWTGIGISILFFASSWIIADYYQSDTLRILCQLLSVNLFFASATIVPGAMFYRNNVLVDTNTVMDVWSLNQFCLKTFDVLNLNPEVSSHTFRAINTFCVSKKKRILSVISVKTNQRNIAVFCLSCDASRMIECQRVSKLRCLFCDGNRPWSAVLKKLAILYVRMTDCPVSEEASCLAHASCLYHKSCDCTMDICLTYSRDSLVI